MKIANIINLCKKEYYKMKCAECTQIEHTIMSSVNIFGKFEELDNYFVELNYSLFKSNTDSCDSQQIILFKINFIHYNKIIFFKFDKNFNVIDSTINLNNNEITLESIELNESLIYHFLELLIGNIKQDLFTIEDFYKYNEIVFQHFLFYEIDKENFNYTKTNFYLMVLDSIMNFNNLDLPQARKNLLKIKSLINIEKERERNHA